MNPLHRRLLVLEQARGLGPAASGGVASIDLLAGETVDHALAGRRGAFLVTPRPISPEAWQEHAMRGQQCLLSRAETYVRLGADPDPMGPFG